MSNTFSAQVSNWTKQTRQRVNAVYRTAIDMTVDDIIRLKKDGGTIPRKTGNMARSYLLSTTGLPNLGAPDQEYTEPDNSLLLTGVKYGDTVFFGFQSVYARRQNYGGGGITGNYFQDLALAKWTQNVGTAERKLMT